MTDVVANEYSAFEDILEKVTQNTEQDFTTSYNIKVRLRGLTRSEHLWCTKADDKTELELRLISKGLVQPKLSREQIRQWQSQGVSESVAEISNKIGELSGLFEDADKSDV